MGAVFSSLFIAPGLFSYVPRWRTKLFFRENWVQAFPPDYRPWPMHSLTFETSFTAAHKERIKGWFFSIESDDQPVFLVSLPGLLQKASECLVSAPSHFFFVSFRNHRCPFWNHCFNKQQIMRRRLQNKRASQLRPLNSGRKRQGFLWGTCPQRPIAHSLRECGLSIFTAFDMPRFSNPCRDSKYHRYDFEFLEQSPVNNKQINDTSLFMRHSTRRKTRM